MKPTTDAKLSLQDLTMIALCTAVIAVMAQISIPMPMGVPMTMQTFAITLVAVLLGAKKSAIAALAYLLLGAVGAPVFAGFTGGFQYFVDPTGGFLLSFPLMAFAIGYGADRFHRSRWVYVFWLVFGTVLNYVVGVLFFCLITKSPVVTGVTACVLPFIPTAVIKAVLASFMGFQIRERLGNLAWN